MNDSAQRQVLNKANMGIDAGIPLQASDGGIEQLRADIQRLMDIEAIKQLKHAYFRCLDTANQEEMATLFHEDVLVHFKGGHYEWELRGRDEYLANVGAAFSKQAVGHHNGHHPEIQMLSETEATGIWYLADNMWILNHKSFTTGTALYWDRYEKVQGHWLIKETRYERIYEISQQLEEAPALSSHYLGAHGPDAVF
ncbi:MAG: nuclear transport factor 2 family protein [Halieaceae bacterium]